MDKAKEAWPGVNEEAYPSHATFTLEVRYQGKWGPVRRKITDLPRAQEVRAGYGERHPGLPTRIVMWGETATVVETDKEKSE